MNKRTLIIIIRTLLRSIDHDSVSWFKLTLSEHLVWVFWLLISWVNFCPVWCRAVVEYVAGRRKHIISCAISRFGSDHHWWLDLQNIYEFVQVLNTQINTNSTTAGVKSSAGQILGSMTGWFFFVLVSQGSFPLLHIVHVAVLLTFWVILWFLEVWARFTKSLLQPAT